jgi:hypothetical protein
MGMKMEKDNAVIGYRLVFNGEFNQDINWDKFQEDFNIGSFYVSSKKYVQGDKASYHEHCDNLKFLKEEDGITVSMVDTSPGNATREFILQNNWNSLSNVEEYCYAAVINEILLATGNKVSKVEVKRASVINEDYEVGSNILSDYSNIRMKKSM